MSLSVSGFGGGGKLLKLIEAGSFSNSTNKTFSGGGVLLIGSVNISAEDGSLNRSPLASKAIPSMVVDGITLTGKDMGPLADSYYYYFGHLVVPFAESCVVNTGVYGSQIQYLYYQYD